MRYLPIRQIKECFLSVVFGGAVYTLPIWGTMLTTWLDNVQDAVLDNTIYNVEEDPYDSAGIANDSLRHYMPEGALPEDIIAHIRKREQRRNVEANDDRQAPHIPDGYYTGLTSISDQAGAAFLSPDLSCYHDALNGVADRDAPSILFFQSQVRLLYEQVQACTRSYDANEETQEFFEKMQDLTLAALAQDQELSEWVKGWRDPEMNITQARAEEQYWLKQNIVQRIADTVRAQYGLDPVPVYLVPLSNSSLGGYATTQANLRIIVLNYHEDTGGMDSFEDILSTIFEEVRHSIDISWGLASAEERQQMFEQMEEQSGLAVPDLNGHMVSLMFNMWSYYNVHDIFTILGYPIAAYDYDKYADQYIERSAKKYAARMSENLSLAP